MGELPKITLLEDDGDGHRRYHLEGGTLREDWAEAVRPGRKAECTLTVYHGACPGEDDVVGSYGGEVWPTAWPTMFRVPEISHKDNQGVVYVTPIGLAALLAATAAGDGR